MDNLLLTGQYRQIPPETVHFGAGVVTDILPKLVDDAGAGRAMVVAGHSVVANGLADRIRSALGYRWVGLFDGVTAHVPRRSVSDGALAARELGADILISLGGSSAVDCAKGIAMVLAEGERFDELCVRSGPSGRHVPSMPRAKLPHVAIPTTLSGGEFTHIVGISHEERKVKEIYINVGLAPRAVILDPEMTVATPRELWASTGFKAVDHVVETVCSRIHQPFTDALCLHAIRMLSDMLPASLEPGNLAARGQVQVAAWLSIHGITNTWVGLSHGLCHQLGAACGVPHGIGSCILLPHVMAFNLSHTVERQALLARAAGWAPADAGDNAAAELAASAVRNLVGSLGLPQRLSQIGVPREVLPAVARQTVADPTAITNPRPVINNDEVLGILEAAW